mmetsp:Transcript_45952/g.147705  ORF Transcript_45952/g.147705 Transcript_45952/m.147705 type:complete len:262 (-) Transcript_45952:479-1264(-)
MTHPSLLVDTVPLLVPSCEEIRCQRPLDVGPCWLAILIWAPIVLKRQAIELLNVDEIDVLDNFTLDDRAVTDGHLVGLAALHQVLEVSGVEVAQVHRILQGFLIELIPMLLIVDPFLVVVVRDFRDGCVHVDRVWIVQLQQLSDVSDRKGSVLVEVIPDLGHVMLERGQGRDQPLDVQLELRRREVEALDNLAPQLLLRDIAFEDRFSPLRIPEEDQGGGPELRLDQVQDLQPLLRLHEQKPPIRDVILCRNPIQMARRQR